VAEPIRVLVADDHALFRRRLEIMLGAEEDIEVVGRAADGVAALRLASRNRPDVVLMNFHLPYGGIRATSAIKRAVPHTRIVIFMPSNNEDDLFDAIKAGAVGYLLKSGPVDDIAATVRSVYNGTSLLNPSMASQIIDEFASMARNTDNRMTMPRLTSRELEVLKLIVEQHANDDIGRRLSISENTVKNHVRNILAKLQFTNYREI
jgi:DNA-binding NarL/FixJ family response regulator